MKKILSVTLIMVLLVSLLGCTVESGTQTDTQKQLSVSKNLEINQPTPTDIDYSLERYNLTRRAYWVNGQREKARTLPCQIADVPLGYIILLTESGAVINKFIVEGKVTSLNSFLTSDSVMYEQEYGSDGYSKGGGNKWLADVDGSYGENDNGIFFFTPDGKYIEWTGIYLYSDIPFEVSDPVVKVGK